MFFVSLSTFAVRACIQIGSLAIAARVCVRFLRLLGPTVCDQSFLPTTPDCTCNGNSQEVNCKSTSSALPATHSTMATSAQHHNQTMATKRERRYNCKYPNNRVEAVLVSDETHWHMLPITLIIPIVLHGKCLLARSPNLTMYFSEAEGRPKNNEVMSIVKY